MNKNQIFKNWKTARDKYQLKTKDYTSQKSANLLIPPFIMFMFSGKCTMYIHDEM